MDGLYRSSLRVTTHVRVRHTYFRPVIEDGVLLAVLVRLPARLRDSDHDLGWIVEPAQGR